MVKMYQYEFDIPIKEDRENPIYPRATELSAEEVRFFSKILFMQNP